MRFYLVKILFTIDPFEFKNLKVYGPDAYAKEMKRLKSWRPQHYDTLTTSRRVNWTDEKFRNVYLLLPVDAHIKIPPLNRVGHIFISHVMPYLNHTKENLEDRGKNH